MKGVLQVLIGLVTEEWFWYTVLFNVLRHFAKSR